MSETTTLLKVGATDLVLRMIEAGVVMRDLTLENPIRAIREISHDITGRRKVRLANGREASALEIQSEYLPKARDFVDRRGIDEGIVQRVLDLWERTLHGGRHREPRAGRPRDRLGDQAQADRALQRQARPAAVLARGSPSSTSPTTTSAATAGCTTCSSAAGRSSGSPRDLEIFEAKSVPPQTTRARLRGEFIRRAQERRRDFTVDWVHLKLNDQAQRTVLCKDPFRVGRRAGGEAHRRHVSPPEGDGPGWRVPAAAPMPG